MDGSGGGKPTTCNIDRTGRLFRFGSGLLCVAVGVGCLVATAWSSSTGLLIGFGVGFIAAGLFQFYEAYKGWCIMRAMGFKTPY